MAVNWLGENWRESTVNYNWTNLGGPVLLVVGIVLGAVLFGRDGLLDYLTNGWTEMLGIAVTVVIVDRLAEFRAKNREITEAKSRLLRQVCSRANEIAVVAVEEMADRDWLGGNDGLLVGKDLRGANLMNASFRNANLCRSRLRHANLQESGLKYANLTQSDLRNTNLSKARLRSSILVDARLRLANLQNAQLKRANLHGADLTEATLHGANLVNANLEDVILQQTTFNNDTILPDGTQWTPDTDMTRFTNPKHPDFWRPIPDEDGRLPKWYTTEGQYSHGRD